jgi:hypothetical protein
MMKVSTATRRLLWVGVFGVAFGFVESSVVVYLRTLYYPEGFSFPLKLLRMEHLSVELIREVATLVMLGGVGMLAGNRGWSRFGFFMVAFGVWDIFYYVWLKLILDWPRAITDWDVLFLIPVPWIGPVISPVLVSVMMIVCGTLTAFRSEGGKYFRPRVFSWGAGICATALLLYSYVASAWTAIGGGSPEPYRYTLLISAVVLYVAGLVSACTPPRRARDLNA